MITVMTEKDAAGKLCVRSSEQILSGPIRKYCYGSQCMAWRVFDTVFVDRTTGLNSNRNDNGNGIGTARGYCGLAGPPEWTPKG
jgi:hypothetical protein